MSGTLPDLPAEIRHGRRLFSNLYAEAGTVDLFDFLQDHRIPTRRKLRDNPRVLGLKDLWFYDE